MQKDINATDMNDAEGKIVSLHAPHPAQKRILIIIKKKIPPFHIHFCSTT